MAQKRIYQIAKEISVLLVYWLKIKELKEINKGLLRIFLLPLRKLHKLTKKNIKVLRPNIGISSIYYEKILGKKSPLKIKCFEPLKLNIIKKLKKI